MSFEFWDVVLDPVFLTMFGLVMLPIGILGYSVLITWLDNTGEEEPE